VAIEPLIRTADPSEFGVACAAMVAAAVWGLFYFVRAIRLSRLLTDLPRANIRSAPQGHVRLQGRARMLAGEPVIAPLSGQPCVWYRFTVEQRDRDPEHDGFFSGWQRVDRGVSDAIFALDDETGRCVLDPDGADVMPSATRVWRGRSPRPGFAPRSASRWNRLFSAGPYRYTESRILENDPLGAVGDFQTLSSGPVSSPDEEVRILLTAWKRDRRKLLHRFDGNRDGEVDLTEWEHAQRAAEQVVMTGRHERPPTDPVHVIRKPRDGRPFCLFAAEPAAIAARHRWNALTGGALFIGMVSLLSAVLYLRFGP